MTTISLALLQDMLQVWSNCATYNSNPNDFVHKLGKRCERTFHRLWASSGLCSASRARRTNAGVAAEKYEPADELPPSKRPATGSKHPSGALLDGMRPARSRQVRRQRPGVEGNTQAGRE